MENDNKPIKIAVVGNDVARLNKIMEKHCSEPKESPDIVIVDSVPPKEEIHKLKPQIVPDDYDEHCISYEHAKELEDFRTRRERNRKAWDRNRKKPF